MTARKTTKAPAATRKAAAPNPVTAAGTGTPAAFEPFDVFSAPLEGTQLLEASAGTGKTWTLTALHLRLLLEADLPIAGILVVTFTEASVADLRARIRQRLVDARHVLEGLAGADDAAVVDIVAQARVVLAERAPTPADGTRVDVDHTLLLRVKRALAEFDDAPIRTIHAFCQGVLRESAFAAGLPLEVQTLTDDAELRLAAVVDFWRREVTSPALPVALAGWLARFDIGPERWEGVLRDVEAFPLARRLWTGAAGTPTATTAAVDDAAFAESHRALGLAFERARATWQRHARDVQAALVTASHGNSYTRPRIEAAHAVWARHFERAEPLAPLPDAPTLLRLYGTSWLQRNRKMVQRVPVGPLFDDIQNLLDAHAALEQHLRAATSALKQRMVAHAARSLHEAKAAQGVQTFQDMLTRTHERLRDDAALAAGVRARYPAALIDEFQDTDPVQLDIFERLYDRGDGNGGTRGCVFMVGDPKQAIYAFRGADLASYLRARGRDGRRAWSLDHNQRASPELLGTINALFSRHAHVFGDTRLAYRRSDVGPAQRTPFVDTRGVTGQALRVWSLPADIDTLAAAQQAAARACAADIARTLEAAQAGDVRCGERALRGGDIAVLVRTNKEGQAMRAALAEVGVAAVELSRVSVFASLDAAEVEVLLHAVLEPSHPGKLRAAMATTLLGVDAGQLAALRSPASDVAGMGEDAAPTDDLARDADALLDTTLARLLAWRSAWQRHGVAAMLARVLADADIAERLLPGADGERRLTNLLHLMELLGRQEPATPLPQALLHWLGRQRLEPDARDEVLLRLESDRQLVQIVTVHRSKGLEYPIVHLPFLWLAGAGQRRTGGRARRWHDDEDRLVLDFRDERDVDKDALARETDEATAESLRLMYVALTRAVHRCTLVVDHHVRARRYASLKSTLNWIVAAPLAAPGPGFDGWRKVNATTAARRSAQIEQAWRRLADDTPHLDLSPLPAAHADAPVLVRDDDATPVSRFPAPGPIEASWRSGSFSSFLHGDAGASAVLDAFESSRAVGLDHDTPSPTVPSDVDSDSDVNDSDTSTDREPAQADARTAIAPTSPVILTDVDILNFSRGTSAGDAMHAALERADFTRPDTWPGAAAAALRLHPQRGAVGDVQAMLEGMLRHVSAVEMLPGLTLAQVGPAQRANEVEFDLPMSGLRLDRLQAAMHRMALPVPPLGGTSGRAHAAQHGHLRGFVDTVFEHHGRWYLADWKSNHLGDTPAHYAQPALERVVAAQGYHLQHVLYAIALLRHLRLRLGHAAADAAWGGAFVLFVRGMRPGWTDAEGRPTGVFHRRLEPARLDALADGFDHAARSAGKD